MNSGNNEEDTTEEEDDADVDSDGNDDDDDGDNGDIERDNGNTPRDGDDDPHEGSQQIPMECRWPATVLQKICNFFTFKFNFTTQLTSSPKNV